MKSSKALIHRLCAASAFCAALCACVSLESLRAGRGQGASDAGTDAKIDGTVADAARDGGPPVDDAAVDGQSEAGETCVVCEDFETNDFLATWLVQRETPDAGLVTLKNVANAPSPTRAVEVNNPASASGTTLNMPTTTAGATELECSFHMNAVSDNGGDASQHIFALMVTKSGAGTQVFTLDGLNRAQFGEADDAGNTKFTKQVSITTQFAPNTFHKYRIRLVDGAAELSVDDGKAVPFAVPVKTPIDNFFMKFGTVLTNETISDGGLSYPVIRLVDSVRCVKR